MNIGIMWFRQDLRLQDNPALIEACAHHEIVLPIYIYDKRHPVLGAAQAWWLHHSLFALKQALHKQGLNLVLRQGDPLDILTELIQTLSITGVYWNRCYEPAAIVRDKKIKTALKAHGIKVQSSNSSLLHEPWTIQNKQGEFFKVFTPYWKTCRHAFNIQPCKPCPDKPKGIKVKTDDMSTWHLLPKLNWAKQFSDFWTPGEDGAQQRLDAFIEHHLKKYKQDRDFPAKPATSRLSPHLHFGEISPWSIVRAVESAKLDVGTDLTSAEHFLSELGWREFSVYLLYHFPTLPSENFKTQFDRFPWQNNEQLFKHWQTGTTGYPIIDAGMRDLWATGFMHNRVRMVVASFLTKGLLIDWRRGADWFLDTLVDADLASNSASWQWVAGCGADAAPYFRIFNPILQSQKFDPNGSYIRRWVPELSSLPSQDVHAPWTSSQAQDIKYPRPIIDHSEARAQALHYYDELKNQDPA